MALHWLVQVIAADIVGAVKKWKFMVNTGLGLTECAVMLIMFLFLFLSLLQGSRAS